jgi:hypothetical protein
VKTFFLFGKFVFSLALLVGAGVFWASGCGNDDGDEPPDEECTARVDHRDGRWEVVSETTQSGGEPGECTNTSSATDTLDQCYLDFCTVDFPGLDFDCSFDRSGSEFDFVCGGAVSNTAPCLVVIRLEGSGEATDTTFSLTTLLTTRVTSTNPDVIEDCRNTYGDFDSPCTTRVVTTARWLAAFPDSVEPACSDSLLETSGVSLRGLVLSRVSGLIAP